MMIFSNCEVFTYKVALFVNNGNIVFLVGPVYAYLVHDFLLSAIEVKEDETALILYWSSKDGSLWKLCFIIRKPEQFPRRWSDHWIYRLSASVLSRSNG